jgi:hypothetical protein
MSKNAIVIIGIISIILFIYGRELQLKKGSPIYILDYVRWKKNRQLEEERQKVAELLDNQYVLNNIYLPPVSDIKSPNLPEPVNFRPRWTFPETVPSDYLSIVSKRPYMSMNPPFSNY